MKKKLKVYGVVASSAALPEKLRKGVRQTRCVVAATSKTVAGELFGLGPGETRGGHGPCETGNPIELEAALSRPGVVFACDLDARSKPFVVAITYPRPKAKATRAKTTSTAGFFDEAEDRRWAREARELRKGVMSKKSGPVSGWSWETSDGDVLDGAHADARDAGEHCPCWDDGKLCCDCGAEKDTSCSGRK